MKLKMARNSLFAVLLRSPWWISFALVLLVALASRALLPEQYVLFGVMGGFPFLVIGGIAAYRQLRAPGDEEIAHSLRVLEAAKAANGMGAYVVDGKMIDPPFFARAQQIVTDARQMGLIA